MIGMDIETERPQQPDAADAEDDLLFEPIDVVAAIKVMRQCAVVFAVLLKIGVEEQDRDLVAVRAGMDREPGPDPDRLCLDLHSDHRIERRAPALDVPGVRPLIWACPSVSIS